MSGKPMVDRKVFTVDVPEEADVPVALEKVKKSLTKKSAEDPKVRIGSKMWSVKGNNFSACDEAVEQLPAGQYVVHYNHHTGEIFFQKKDVSLDDLISLPDDESERVVQDIKEFWPREEHYRNHGMLHKRGILLWGPPGSGKTTTLQQISNHVIEQGGISVYCNDPEYTARGLTQLRYIEPHRPVVLIMEDIDATLQYYNESSVLALLDGELQIDNIVTIATTNYPEKLDKRFINRPSRFDEVIYVGFPNDEGRRVFLSKKSEILAADQDKLEQWVKDTEGFSIAHMRELIASVLCLGKDYTFTIERLRKMINNEPVSGSEGKGKIGFTD